MGIKDIENLTVEDIKPITISFKKNEDELDLYKWIIGHSGYSGFVKDTLRDAKSKDTKQDKTVASEVQTNLIDLGF